MRTPDLPPPDLGTIRFRRHRDVGSVLNATVRFLRENVRELLRTYLVVVLPVALASGVSIAILFGQFGEAFADPEAFASDPEAVFGASYLGALAFGLLGSALTLAAGGGYIRLYREGLAGEISAGDVWEEAKGLVLPYVGLFLLFGLFGGLSGVIIAVPFVGFLAWVALLLWLLPRIGVLVAVRALERPSLAASWSRTNELVKGAWGFVFGSMLLAAVVFYVLMIVVSIPVSILAMVVGLNMLDDPSSMMTGVGAVFAPLQVLSYAGTLIPVAAAFFVHGRLVEDLDGTTLHGDLDALAGEAGTARSSAFEPRAPTPPADAPPASTPPPDDAGTSGGFRGGGFGR